MEVNTPTEGKRLVEANKFYLYQKGKSVPHRHGPGEAHHPMFGGRVDWAAEQRPQTCGMWS